MISKLKVIQAFKDNICTCIIQINKFLVVIIYTSLRIRVCFVFCCEINHIKLFNIK